MKDGKELFEWLNKFLNETITVNELPKNIFDISGYPHYENVISNIYAFFLREEEEHNFGRLFLDSLLELVPVEYFDERYSSSDFVGEYQVAREFYSNESGRIDLVISSKQVDDYKDEEKDKVTNEVDGTDYQFKDWVLIIENKINHSLENNLEDYWDTFDNKMMKLGIVLSLDEVDIENANFLNILHKDLLENVISNLKNSFLNSSDKYLIYLKDFIQNILNQRNLPNMENIDKNFKLYKENKIKIDQLKILESQVFLYVNKSIKDFFDLTHFSNSPEGESVKSGRHFFGKSDSFYEPFRFWINFCGIFEHNELYIYFQIHNKRYTKIDFKFEKCSNKFLLTNGGGIDKDYRNLFKKDIKLDPTKMFSMDISKKLKEEVFRDEPAEDGIYELNEELQCVVDSFTKALNNNLKNN